MSPTGKQGVTVIGGGLVGSLWSIYLARRGFEVEVYERGADLRAQTGASGRSINLVVTSRGIDALRAVGLRKLVDRLAVPVMGRMVHSTAGELAFQPYGKDDTECNYSISRADLNRELITQAATLDVRFHFEHELSDLDPVSGALRFKGRPDTATAEVIFGADGGGSVARTVLARLGHVDHSLEFLTHGYRELLIPAAPSGDHVIEKNALHIWPRGELMLMALPNLDGSFTVTLYMPNEGPQSFAEIDRPQRVEQLFAKHFADALPLFPDLSGSYLANPTGFLGTVRCRPWHHGGRVLLIGDAAHAIVPFFGQGMNAGFEDCTLLDRMIGDQGIGDWAGLFEEFGEKRKPDADAIADMALENFVEMRDRVGDPRFLLRKQVEHLLENEMPREYRSRYSMVMYSSIPYRVAMEAGRIQQTILDELCRGLDDASGLDLDRARELVRARLSPHLERHAVELDY